jgi:hypothetical protein
MPIIQQVSTRILQTTSLAQSAVGTVLVKIVRLNDESRTGRNIMPNWCQNEVKIYIEDKEVMQEFKDFCKGEIKYEDGSKVVPFCFASIMPEPDYDSTPVARTFPDIKAQFANSDEEKAVIMENEPSIREGSWWDWRVQNWGTKWEANGMTFEEDGNEIQMVFDTPWSAPTGIYNALKEKFGDKVCISWFYREEGCQFAGYLNTD